MGTGVDEQVATHVAGHVVMAHLVGRPLGVIRAAGGDCVGVWAPRTEPRYSPLDLMVMAAGAAAEI